MSYPKPNIIFGATYVDRITGFRGVLAAHCVYYTGCNQALLIPKVDESGKLRESEWFDDQRLEMEEGSQFVTLDNGDTPGCDKAAPKI